MVSVVTLLAQTATLKIQNLTNGNIVLTYAKYNSGSYERSFKIYNPEPIRLEAQYN